jgi:rhodanese-related sulfurtransferase
MFKRINSMFLIAIMALGLVLSSCSEDTTTTPTKSESEILIEYLEGAEAGNYINVAGSNIAAASVVKTNITTDPAKNLVIDIRDTATYKKGHIANAVNVPFANIWSYVKANDLTKYTNVYMVCYSGQSAAYATGLLRMYGLNNVFSMKFGMSSWDSTFATTWKTGIGNIGATQFKQDSVAKPALGNLPTLTTGKTTGKTILEDRIAAAFAAGFPSVKADVVLGNQTSYFVMAYWTLADYKDPGHFPGAPCYVPKSDFKLSTFLKSVPANKTCAIYCYTGHTAAYAAAFLKVMGYDIKSISFGGNAMIYDQMVAKGKSAWKDSEIMNYGIVK